jgi:hypothetical protein
MKKMLLIGCSLASLAIHALPDVQAEILAQFAQELKGKIVHLSPEIIRSGIEVELENITLHIKELEQILNNLPSEQGSYLMAPPKEVLKKLIGDMKLIKNDIQNIVVPSEGVQKNLDDIVKHLLVEEKKLKYQSKIYTMIAQQLHSKSALVLAHHAEEQADSLARAVTLIATGKPVSKHHVTDVVKDKARKVIGDLQKQADTKINREIDSYKKEAGKKIEDAIDYVSKKVKELYDRYKNQLQPNE